jgi:hypothetical protein
MARYMSFRDLIGKVALIDLRRFRRRLTAVNVSSPFRKAEQ